MFLLLLLTTLLTPARATCTESAALSVRSEVYLGRERDGRPVAGPRAWRRFLREDVTPGWPGFTVLEARGYWKDAPERSRILVLLHAPGEEPRVNAVAEAYRVAFGQEAVFVVHAPVVTLVCET